MQKKTARNMANALSPRKTSFCSNNQLATPFEQKMSNLSSCIFDLDKVIKLTNHSNDYNGS